MTEHELQNEIRVKLSQYCILFRVNVASGETFDGRYISTGVPAGFSDLFGHRFSDGKAVYIEVKTPNGKPSRYQTKFMDRMKATSAIAGICRSVDEAINLVAATKNP